MDAGSLRDTASGLGEPVRTGGCAGCVRRVGLGCLGFVILLVALYAFRSPILRGAANLWIVNDPTTNADAIVILGGGLEYRTFAAADMYHSGAAPTLLITQSKLSPSAKLGVTVPEFKESYQVLLAKEVPPQAIQMLGTNVTSTRDEAVALKDWVGQNHAHSVIIPTDIFHTRRARWIFTKALRGTGAQVHVVATDPPQYRRTDWWRHEEGLIAFQNELIKMAYYWLKY